MNLSLEGIGATLQSEDDETSIKSLVPGAPAERSKKLQAGDKIIGVGQEKRRNRRYYRLAFRRYR